MFCFFFFSLHGYHRYLQVMPPSTHTRSSPVLVGAGCAIDGAQTVPVLTIGTGVDEFTLDSEIGSWRMTDGPMEMPHGNAEFAINMAGRRQWSPGIARYIEERIQGTEGPLGKDYNMRWNARSEERRVGKGRVRTCSSGGSSDN